MMPTVSSENLRASVNSKIPCIFETIIVSNAPSSKHPDQQHRVVASNQLHAEATAVLARSSCIATEKVDGTCVFIQEYFGQPWLWARYDKKPNKVAEKRFRQFMNQGRASHAKEGESPVFSWDISADFKEAPPEWIPAAGVIDSTGQITPESNSHIPGWVPVDSKSRQHCWHSSVVDLTRGVCLLLQPMPRSVNSLEVVIRPLSDLVGETLELIGTNVNGNPYKLGSKQKPIHLLVPHGCIRFVENPPTNYADLLLWFTECHEGRVEGIVWHGETEDNKTVMFKLHRHHMGLTWPVEDLRLLSYSVNINIDCEQQNSSQSNHEFDSSLMNGFCKLAGRTFTALDKISLAVQ